jgi:hypothetical protein
VPPGPQRRDRAPAHTTLSAMVPRVALALLLTRERIQGRSCGRTRLARGVIDRSCTRAGRGPGRCCLYVRPRFRSAVASQRESSPRPHCLLPRRPRRARCTGASRKLGADGDSRREEPCSACGAVAWDEVRPDDESRGSREAPGGRIHPARRLPELRLRRKRPIVDHLRESPRWQLDPLALGLKGSRPGWAVVKALDGRVTSPARGRSSAAARRRSAADGHRGLAKPRGARNGFKAPRSPAVAATLHALRWKVPL